VVEIACVAQTQDILGEVPRWHPIERMLYWIDAFKPAIHRLDPVSAALESWTPPEKLGSFAPRVGRGLLIAGRRGLAHYRWRPRCCGRQRPNVRAQVDRGGRLAFAFCTAQ
jgi:sugar lactone lactonase YvrE